MGIPVRPVQLENIRTELEFRPTFFQKLRISARKQWLFPPDFFKSLQFAGFSAGFGKGQVLVGLKSAERLL